MTSRRSKTVTRTLSRLWPTHVRHLPPLSWCHLPHRLHFNRAATPAQTTEEENIVLPPLFDKIQYVPPHAAKSPGRISHSPPANLCRCLLTSLGLCGARCPDASAVLEVSLKQFWKLFFADSKFYSNVHYAKGDKGNAPYDSCQAAAANLNGCHLQWQGQESGLLLKAGSMCARTISSRRSSRSSCEGRSAKSTRLNRPAW
jgi:hypothetical protein